MKRIADYDWYQDTSDNVMQTIAFFYNDDVTCRNKLLRSQKLDQIAFFRHSETVF